MWWLENHGFSKYVKVIDFVMSKAPQPLAFTFKKKQPPRHSKTSF